MTDTVFLFGAGFSKAAGVPLLGDFVETMWELAVGRRKDADLSSSDHELFLKAMKIRDELDGYHGRAMFNDRNIEDVLSILSFNSLGGGKNELEQLATMSHAIARTIDLTCNVQHPGVGLRTNSVVEDGPALYRGFWNSVFSAINKKHSMPSIITFNYDLVLERSLLQTLIGTHYNHTNPLPFKRFKVDYHFHSIKTNAYEITYPNYMSHGSRGLTNSQGTALRLATEDDAALHQSIEILKLHGSLNFPKSLTRPSDKSTDFDTTLSASVSDPYILPPVFNKMSQEYSNSVWRVAIDRIRSAKNVVVVGYSLPSTDIYVQYFLKAAIGPNRNLNRIVVFDPVLFLDNDACAAMKSRYASCFSPQLRDRIDFCPVHTSSTPVTQGTADAFVRMLARQPGRLMF